MWSRDPNIYPNMWNLYSLSSELRRLVSITNLLKTARRHKGKADERNKASYRRRYKTRASGGTKPVLGGGTKLARGGTKPTGGGTKPAGHVITLLGGGTPPEV